MATRTQVIDGVCMRYVRDLKPGDRVDLENDLWANTEAALMALEDRGLEDDLKRTHEFAFEFQVVDEVEDESTLFEPCIRVDFTSGFSCGFPPDHLVGVDGEQEGG